MADGKNTSVGLEDDPGTALKMCEQAKAEIRETFVPGPLVDPDSLEDGAGI